MAIYGIGAYYDKDVSSDFITHNLAGVGWSFVDAPELHKFIASIKVGDIIYIKAASPSSPDIIVRGIGIIRDDVLLTARPLRAWSKLAATWFGSLRRSFASRSPLSATTSD